MSQEIVDLARRGYEALAAGDLERVLELIDPDVELEVLTGRPDLPARLHGHEGFVENIKGLTDVFEDIEIVPEDFVEVGDELVVSIFTAGHGRSSGIRIENRIVHVWTIRDGKAVRFRVYPTKEQALAAVGLVEPGERQRA
jgi:ketosteroid isomerase-like protein